MDPEEEYERNIRACVDRPPFLEAEHFAVNSDQGISLVGLGKVAFAGRAHSRKLKAVIAEDAFPSEDYRELRQAFDNGTASTLMGGLKVIGFVEEDGLPYAVFDSEEIFYGLLCSQPPFLQLLLPAVVRLMAGEPVKALDLAETAIQIAGHAGDRPAASLAHILAAMSYASSPLRDSKKADIEAIKHVHKAWKMTYDELTVRVFDELLSQYRSFSPLPDEVEESLYEFAATMDLGDGMVLPGMASAQLALARSLGAKNPAKADTWIHTALERGYVDECTLLVEEIFDHSLCSATTAIEMLSEFAESTDDPERFRQEHVVPLEKLGYTTPKRFEALVSPGETVPLMTWDRVPENFNEMSFRFRLLAPELDAALDALFEMEYEGENPSGHYVAFRRWADNHTRESQDILDGVLIDETLADAITLGKYEFFNPQKRWIK